MFMRKCGDAKLAAQYKPSKLLFINASRETRLVRLGLTSLFMYIDCGCFNQSVLFLLNGHIRKE